jgi:hypothetical protein
VNAAGVKYEAAREQRMAIGSGPRSRRVWKMLEDRRGASPGLRVQQYHWSGDRVDLPVALPGERASGHGEAVGLRGDGRRAETSTPAVVGIEEAS